MRTLAETAARHVGRPFRFVWTRLRVEEGRTISSPRSTSRRGGDPPIIHKCPAMVCSKRRGDSGSAYVWYVDPDAPPTTFTDSPFGLLGLVGRREVVGAVTTAAQRDIGRVGRGLSNASPSVSKTPADTALPPPAFPRARDTDTYPVFQKHVRAGGVRRGAAALDLAYALAGAPRPFSNSRSARGTWRQAAGWSSKRAERTATFTAVRTSATAAISSPATASRTKICWPAPAAATPRQGRDAAEAGGRCQRCAASDGQAAIFA